MKTLLDKPLFNLKPDAGPRLYANICNTLEVVRAGKVSYRHIQIGASLFHLMHHLKVPVDSEVTVYLDIEKGRAVFGIMINEQSIHDLWSYADNLLPPFLD